MKDLVIQTLTRIDFSREFLIDEINGRSYSYNSFFEKCIAIAEQFKSRNEKSIFAVLENGIDLFSLYFVAILSGKRIYVADPEKGVTEIQNLIDEMDETIFLCDKEGLVNGEYSFVNFNLDLCVESEQIKKQVTDAFERFDFNENYLTTFTSGTSGKTKGVVNSLGNLFSTTFSFCKLLDVPTEGTFLHLMPMTYMAGILNSIFMPFIMGYKIVINKRFSVRQAMTFWKTIEKYNVNLLWVSPMMLTMIEKVDRSTKFEEYCRGHEIVFLVGTAPLTKETREKFEDRYGLKVRASYGLSETLFISVETEKSIENTNRENVGEILPGVECNIQQDAELWLKVPWIYLGYTNEDTAKYFEGEYYKTGDLVTVEDGILKIIGRKKDLIIRGGMNISPKLIEDCIMRTNLLEECAVYSKKNILGEEDVCCAYVSNSIVQDSSREIEIGLEEAVKKELGKNYQINMFVRLDALPRNINGKIDKNVLAAM